jgi:Concanavalin A-like lectin/glucanases superfamily
MIKAHVAWISVALAGCSLAFPIRERSAGGGALDAGADSDPGAGTDATLPPPDAISDAQPNPDTGTDTGSDARAEAEAGPVLSAYAMAVLADKPLAYYPLDEATGPVARNAAAIDGAPTCEIVGTIAWRKPAIRGGGAGAAGLGTTGHFSCESARFDFANRVPFTLEIWVKLRSHNPSLVYYPFARQQVQGAGFAGYNLFVTDIFGVGVQRLNSDSVYVNVPPPIPAIGAWTHLVGTMNGSELRIYVNGLRTVDAVADARSIPALAVPLLLGLSDDGSYMDADFDEVAIYDRALDITRIAAHYAAGN